MTEKKSNPTVSVIIPAFNRAHIVGRAIQSVLKQTYQDFELIIVDDGSTDNTEEVVKSFNDDRIRYIRHERNKGAPAARNTGIQAARGKYLAFQDSDDEWLPEKLEEQMNALIKAPSEVGVIYSGFWRVEGNKRVYIPSAKIKKKEGDIHESLLEENFVTTQAVIIKSECFKKVGMFDERLPRLQEWELFIRISKYYEFILIDKPLLIAYYQKDGISTNLYAFIQSLEIILSKHYKSFEKAGRRQLLKQYSLLGDALCRQGEMSRGRSYLLKAIKTYPFDAKNFFATLISVFGSNIYSKISDVRLNILRRKNYK